jgi:hypothetical protein
VRRDLTAAWRAKLAARHAYEAVCAPKRSMPADYAAARSDAPANKVGAAASSRTTQEQVATALAEHGTAAAMAQAPE